MWSLREHKMKRMSPVPGTERNDMALLQVDYKSKMLGRKVHFNVILPTDMEEESHAPYPTLYLLHGIFGNSTSWLTSSCVQRYAEDKGICVVMPDGENGFYVDHPDYMNRFSSWVGQELVEVTRKLFHLSDRREDTWLCGFSMGGYGALRNGLKYSDTFGKVIAFSGALILDMPRTPQPGEGSPISSPYMKAMFGDMADAVSSDLNPAWIVRKLAEEGKPLPDLYISCGEQDGLLEANQKFIGLLDELKIPYTWRTTPGGHDWDFWEQEIRHVIKNWL